MLGAFEILDISPRLHARTAVFPGDTPMHQKWLCRMDQGDSFTLSTLETTVHLGAHTDAPSHYAVDGLSIEKRPLSLYLGPAQVVRVDNVQGRRILMSDWGNRKVQAERVLFATGTFPNPDHWREDFAALSPELIDWLATQGVRLVGIDTPSIDPATAKVLESHAAVYRADMAILEGIVLDGVPEGVYTLVALPLKLAGSDASPVRAVLLK